jgi:hypothetical protein
MNKILKSKASVLVIAIFALFITSCNKEEPAPTPAPAIEVNSVTVEPNVLELVVAAKQTLTATVSPEDATTKTVTWHSSDTSIVHVAFTGESTAEITAKAAGKASIVVTTSNDKTDTCEVTVVKAFVPLTGITITPEVDTLKVGDTVMYVVTPLPADATDYPLVWSSSNTAVATVSTTGLVTAASAGTTTITVTSGSFSDSVAVTVVIFRSNGDYYKTGDVINFHRHTVGNGVAIVIIGDGFDHEDCRIGGVYEYNCQKLTELFLSMPVVRDYKDYFDICARVDVSVDRGARNCVNTPNNCPDNVYGSGHSEPNWVKIASNAVDASGNDVCSIIFMGNGMIGGAAYGHIAIYSADEPNKAYWMIHEFVGHAFGGLPDMYYVWGDQLMNDKLKKAFDDAHLSGNDLMFDWRDDPNEVLWKDFIGRWGYEMVDVYQAGLEYIKFGEIFTCENITTSVMYGPSNPHYTVMERYQLWRRMHTRAGFTTVTMDDFIAYDVVNLKTSWSWKIYEVWTDDRIWKAE